MSLKAPESKGGSFLFTPADGRDVLFPEDFSADAREFGRTVRGFIAKEVEPQATHLDEGGMDDVPALLKSLGDIGFFMAEVPESFGGMGLPLFSCVPMIEQLGRAGGFGVAAMVHQGIGMQPLVFCGTEELAARWMPELMRGETLAAYALTEPGSGSDALSGKTTAVFDATTNEWVLNGTKQFITNARWAKVFQVFANVDGKGFSAFMVERDTPGFTVLEDEHKMGIRCSSTAALRLENVRVPAGNVLGELGRGHKIALNMLNLGRLKLGITMVGAMKQLLAYSVAYGNERMQFGKPLTSFGLIREKLVDMATFIFAGEALAARTAGHIDRFLEEATGDYRVEKFRAADEFSSECSITKCYLTEAASICADHAVQIYGGYGFIEEYPVARFYRDTRVSRLYEGTNEINRLNVMNSLFRRIVKGGDRDTWMEIIHREFDAKSDMLAPMRKCFGKIVETLLERAKGEVPKLDQDVTGALAEFAMELYAAECALLRAQRLAERDDVDAKLKSFAEHLSKLVVAKAGRTIRERAGAVGAALKLTEAAGFATALDDCARLSDERFFHEREAAEVLLTYHGEWPEFAPPCDC